MDIELWTDRARQRVRMLRIAWALLIASYGIAAAALATGDRILWFGVLALAGGVFMTVGILPEVTEAEVGIEGPRLLVTSTHEPADLPKAA